jgi:hypothetical protein
MFFRREVPKNPSFQERIDGLRSAGFSTAPASDGGVAITRDGVGVVLKESGAQVTREARAGVVMGNEIGSLVDGGYQKFFRTPSGRNKPATAGELKAIHEFEEDLKEGFGLESLYNESLGTVSTFYLYDRVQDRDQGVGKRVWES